MRPFALFLPLALCAAVAQAQPDIEVVPSPAPATAFVPQPPEPRTGTLEEQVKADIGLFISYLNTNEAFMSNNAYVYGTNAGYYGANEWAQNWKDRKIQIKLDDIKIDKLEEKQATVTISYHMESELTALNERFKARFKNGVSESLQLRKENNLGGETWQMVPPEKLDPANPETGIFAYITFVIAQKGPVPTEALPYVFNTEANKSLSNLKQLGLGAMQFAQDYDEVFAFGPQYVQEAIKPYIKSVDLFRIPATQQTYTFNANLCGKSLAAIAEPARTIWFYEGQNQSPIFRYDGKAAICFVDGHCVLVSPEDLKLAIWEVQLQKQ